MSDGYRIRIPRSVDQRMSEWSIPDDIRQSMEQHLKQELADDPARCLVACRAPWDERLNLYTFSIPDSTRPNIKYTFMFHVVYSVDENFLDIVHCGFLEINTKP